MRHEFKGWEEEEVMVSVMLLSVLFALLLPFPWQCKLRSWVYLLVVSTPFHISLSATESIRKETADQDFFFFFCWKISPDGVRGLNQDLYIFTASTLSSKLVILAVKKIRLFWWCDLFLTDLFCVLFCHSVIIQILVNWLFNNLFQNISGNWSLADCCEIPWVLLFPFKKQQQKKLQDIWWLAEKRNYLWEFYMCQLQFDSFFYFFYVLGIWLLSWSRTIAWKLVLFIWY